MGPAMTRRWFCFVFDRRMDTPCSHNALANVDGYVLEHRKVLYDAGVEVLRGCHVHHVNGDRSDNRLVNLEVKRPRDHIRDHIMERGGFVRNQFGSWPLRG